MIIFLALMPTMDIAIWKYRKMGLPADVIGIILKHMVEQKLDDLFKPIFERACKEQMFCDIQDYLKDVFLQGVPERYHVRFLQNEERLSDFIMYEFRNVGEEISQITTFRDEYYNNYLNGKLKTVDDIVNNHPRFKMESSWYRVEWEPYVAIIKDLAEFITLFNGEDERLEDMAHLVLFNLERWQSSI